MTSAKTTEKILIIEDDPAILYGLCKNLRYEGYTVVTASDGNAGLSEALSNPPDLIILDIMLPGVDGFEITRTLKRAEIEAPIIILSARSHERDKITSLDLGADDYITKPFSVRELCSRIGAVLRRQRRHSQRQQQEQRAFGPVKVDFAAREVTCGGKHVDLSPREFELLSFFLENPNRVLERSHILNRVWGFDYEGTARTIDNFVTKLRQKLEEDPENPRFFLTARGLGYKFVPAPPIAKKPSRPRRNASGSGSGAHRSKGGTRPRRRS